MRRVQGKLCSDGANTQSRSVGGYSWKNLPIWGKKWDFLLLVQLVLSPVCSSHVKAEGSSKSRWGEEGRALLGSGLWKQWGFMAGFCWSSLLQGCHNPWGEHLSAAFRITESQHSSSWKGP